MKKSAEFIKLFDDLFNGFDLSKLKEELSNFSSFFSGLKPKDKRSSDPKKD